MVGSHNTFSYLPPKNLWGKLTKPWGKCQDLNIQDQYDIGVRCFDVRLRKIDGEWHLVHNKVDYGSCSSNDLYNKLKALCNNHDPVYLRFLLDERQTPENEESYTQEFISYLTDIKNIIPRMIIIECRTFWNWKIHKINDVTCTIEEYHASVRAKWYQYVLGTKWYAKRHNKNILTPQRKVDNKTVTLLDYVEYK